MAVRGVNISWGEFLGTAKKQNSGATIPLLLRLLALDEEYTSFN